MDSLLQQNGATTDAVVQSSTSPLITSVSEVVVKVTGSLDSDDEYIQALGNKLYMASGEHLP